jgi:hypothetical protein
MKYGEEVVYALLDILNEAGVPVRGSAASYLRMKLTTSLR